MSEKDCQSCKKQKLTVSEKSMVVLSVYVLITSIYGTMVIVRSLMDYFN